LARLVEEAGFEVVESRYFFHWLAPPKWLLGRTERALGIRLRHAEVPRRAVNALLYAVSRVEQAAFKHLPWFSGSSILLVALDRTSDS